MIKKGYALAHYLIGMTLIIAAFEMGKRGVEELIVLIIAMPLYGLWTGYMSKRQ